MAINIPERMEKVLKKDSGIYSFTLTSVSNLKPWLDANTTVFFPEYTDHSFIHLNEVLATSQSIIMDESWNTITPEDVSAMIISVLLHDCAMHITEDGFYSLIGDTYPPIRSQYVEAEPKWSVMWSDYIAEAKRFNSDKLKSIFDDTKPVSDIPKDKIELTTRDKLLIGEFIRRHHARIAHEIVFNGVPGTDGKTLKLADEPRRHFLDLCGFIAKSHNMSLRQAVDEIQRKKRRIHLNTHVPFLMSVLRISDYIQVQATRAPSQLLNVKSLISPISKGEWKKHDAILEISHADEDPEALFIDAEPQDALIFEDLRRLFSDMQRELDEVWAVLGEIYGRYDEMSNLGINIRRLRSSLDDIEQYIEDKSPNFIPKVLKFRTADSEMMELLIAPLYGDKPEIGIRELIQNSVDACLERDDIIHKQSITFDKPNDYDVCVSVIEHENYGEVIVEDYGIGMTLDTIENYFLNIGASFRNSDRWKKTHETDGSSDIHRTGRFGIGLLAAYLLGDELEVETRHVNCPKNKGLKFKCRRGSKSVTVSNISCHIGTKISIKTSSSSIKYLNNDSRKWDWYCLNTPKVKRIVLKLESLENILPKALAQNIIVPQCLSELNNSSWNRISTSVFSDLLWSHTKYKLSEGNRNSSQTSPALICNGIIISSMYGSSNASIVKFSWSKTSIIEPLTPTIVVYDQDGELPLNIQRNALTNDSPIFTNILSKDIVKNAVIDFFNLAKPKDFSSFENMHNLVVKAEKLSWKSASSYKYLECFIFSKLGIMILDKAMLQTSKLESLQIIVGRSNYLLEENLLKNEFTNIIFASASNKSLYEKSNWVRNYFELRERGYRSSFSHYVPYRNLSGSRLFIKKHYYSDVCKPGYLPKTFQKKLEVIWENDTWIALEIRRGNMSHLPIFADFESFVKKIDQKEIFGTVLHYFDWNKNLVEHKEEEELSIPKAWLELNSDSPYFKVQDF
ncbi:ATP-binding protein [Psychrobacter sp. Ps7]|uniref:HD domain-containing protein n=1 Tax=Psychrobacter sp. Ps7 TaxID=2790961 RepID=UPI001EDE5333